MALTDDDSATDSLPIALAGMVILIAIIVSLAAFGVRNAMPSVEMASVDRQAATLANDCRFLLSMAPRCLDDPGSPPGAMHNVKLNLPASTEYLSFGYDPDSEGGHEGTIYYRVSSSKKAIVVDERAAFCTADGEHVILRPGSYDLRIEYARDALGRRYLQISGLR